MDFYHLIFFSFFLQLGFKMMRMRTKKVQHRILIASFFTDCILMKTFWGDVKKKFIYWPIRDFLNVWCRPFVVSFSKRKF